MIISLTLTMIIQLSPIIFIVDFDFFIKNDINPILKCLRSNLNLFTIKLISKKTLRNLKILIMNYKEL